RRAQRAKDKAAKPGLRAEPPCRRAYRSLGSRRSLAVFSTLRMTAVPGLANARGVALAGKAQRGNHGAGHAHARAIPGDAIILGQHPNRAGAIVDLVHAIAQEAVGMADHANHGHFFVEIRARVAIDLGHSCLLWATGER